MELQIGKLTLLKTHSARVVLILCFAIACIFAMSTTTSQALADPAAGRPISAILQLNKQIDQIQDQIQEKAKEKKKTEKVDKLIDVAENLKGTPYVYGGSTPAGFDCSGFTMYCYSKVGVSLTHNAAAQYSQGKHVSKKNLKKGDLVFFGSSTSSINHVGIYIGNGKMIHSPHTGAVVRVESIDNHGSYVGACRVLNNK